MDYFSKQKPRNDVLVYKTEHDCGGGSTRRLCSPRVEVGDGFEGLWAPQQLVQDADYVWEAGALGSILQPALDHELVHRGRTVHGGGQPERLINGLHHLRRRSRRRKRS